MFPIEKTLKIFNKNKRKLGDKNSFNKFLDKEIKKTAKMGCYKIILYDYELQRNYDINFKEYFKELESELNNNGYNTSIVSDSYWTRLVIWWK